MPLRIFWFGRHIATLNSQSLTLGLLAGAALVVFACYVHVVQQAVEQGRRHAALQAQAEPAKTRAGTTDALTALVTPSPR